MSTLEYAAVSVIGALIAVYVSNQYVPVLIEAFTTINQALSH